MQYQLNGQAPPTLLHEFRHHLQGDLPVAEFTAAVAATGYRGWRALGIFPDRQPPWAGAGPLQDLTVGAHLHQRTGPSPRPPPSTPGILTEAQPGEPVTSTGTPRA